jgi:hypothetical protein
MQVKSTGWWNDVTVTKIPKIGFSEKLIKHAIRELPTLVSEAKISYIECNEPKFARRPRADVTSVTFLFLVYGSVHHNIFCEISNRCSYMQSILFHC